MSGRAGVVSIISAVGGIGKMTFTLVASYFLARYARVDQREVLLIDMDPTAGLSLKMFSEKDYENICENKKSLYHMDLHFERNKNINIDDYVVSPARYRGSEGRRSYHPSLLNVNVVVAGEEATYDLNDRLERWKSMQRPDRLRVLLEKSGALDRFRFILIDTAPFFDPKYTVNAVASASKAVVLLRPTVTDVLRTMRMVDRLRNYGYAVDSMFLFNLRCGEDGHGGLHAAGGGDKGAGEKVGEARRGPAGACTGPGVLRQGRDALKYLKPLAVLPEAYRPEKELERAELAICPAMSSILAEVGAQFECPAEAEED